MLVKYSQVPTVTNEWFFQPTCRLATDERSFDDVSLVAFVAGVLRRLHKRRSRQTLRACIRHGRRRARSQSLSEVSVLFVHVSSNGADNY